MSEMRSPEGNRRTRRQPRRFLDPELAAGIVAAKEKTGLSWRAIAQLAGRSHGYLILLAQGKRAPSDRTVESLADVLPLDEDVLAGLRRVAVPAEKLTQASERNERGAHE